MINDLFTNSGAFDAVGAIGKKFIKGAFDLVTDYQAAVILNPSATSSIPKAVTGIINETINGIDVPASNVRVSFIKDYAVYDELTDKQYTAFKTIVDWCITDVNGQYTVFVEPGVYAVRVDGGKYAKYYPNQKVTDGLNNEYYYTIKSLIKNRCEDTIHFYGTDKRLVIGIMIDEFNNPVDNAEIIISRGQDVLTYIKTDKDGKYAFAITNGIYDIRVRAKKQSVEIWHNFNFVDGKGLFTDSPRTIEIL